MTAHLVRLCISAAVLGVSLNEAKPVIEEPRFPGHHRFVQYLPRDGHETITDLHSNQYRSKIAPDYLQEDSRAVEASTATRNNRIFRGSARFGHVESNQPLTSRYVTKNVRLSKKPVNRDVPNVAIGVRNNFNSLQPPSSDESGSDSSVLFINPADVSALSSGDLVESQFNGQETSAPPAASAPYPPTVRKETGIEPVVQSNSPGSHNPQTNTDGISYSPSGAPHSPAPREETREVRFTETDSPESVNLDLSRPKVVNSPSAILGETEKVPLTPTNPSESLYSERPLSNISYSSSSAPAVREQIAEIPFMEINSLESPNSNKLAAGALLPPLGSDKEVQDSSENKLRVFSPGFNDDNRISLRLQDEVVRSPFLPNPDFFAFSPTGEVDQLGKLTGRPFGFGGGFNQEGSSIGDATFIVPEGLGKGDVDFELPESEPPQETFGLTIDDGQTIRNELRKETGEFIESYTTLDGTSRSETGTLVPTPSGDRVMVLKGFYSYMSPEGYLVRVDYTSDQTGYHATPTITKPTNAPTATPTDNRQRRYA